MLNYLVAFPIVAFRSAKRRSSRGTTTNHRRFKSAAIVLAAAIASTILFSGCGGGQKSEPQRVALVARLDIQSAKLAYERDGQRTFVISLHAVRTNKDPLPVVPERIMVLIAYGAGEPSRESIQQMLDVREWNWQNSMEGGIPCGVPEIDDATWQIQSSRAETSDAPTKTDSLRFVRSIRPINNVTWEWEHDPVLTFPLEAFTEGTAPPAERRGLAALCLVGLSGAKTVVRLSEPIVVELDPDRTFVSSESTRPPLSKERVLELQDRAEKLAGQFKTRDIASYEANFSTSNDFKDITKVTDLFQQLRDGEDGALNQKTEYEIVLNQPLVLLFTAIPMRSVQPTAESIVAALGEPERKEAGVFQRNNTPESGFPEKERIQVEFFHWAWASVAVDKKTGKCCALRINAAERRIEIAKQK